MLKKRWQRWEKVIVLPPRVGIKTQCFFFFPLQFYPFFVFSSFMASRCSRRSTTTFVFETTPHLLTVKFFVGPSELSVTSFNVVNSAGLYTVSSSNIHLTPSPPQLFVFFFQCSWIPLNYLFKKKKIKYQFFLVYLQL